MISSLELVTRYHRVATGANDYWSAASSEGMFVCELDSPPTSDQFILSNLRASHCIHSCNMAIFVKDLEAELRVHSAGGLEFSK